MTKSLPMATLRQLDAQFREQALEVANLRAALDMQFKRIAQMQAELDMLPQARRRRAREFPLPQPPSHNGNGRSHR